MAEEKIKKETHNKIRRSYFKFRSLRAFASFLFISIIILSILFLVLSPIFWTESTVYRKNKVLNNDLSNEFEKKISDIYSNTNPADSYSQLQRIENKILNDVKENKIDEETPYYNELNTLRKQIVEKSTEKISTVEKLVSTKPFEYLPDFKELIKLYEQIPSLPVNNAMNDARNTFSKSLQSGEDELIEEYKKKHEVYIDIPILGRGLAEELQGLGAKLIKYLDVRIEIAQTTNDVIWAYEIMKETRQKYNDISFDKFIGVKEKLEPRKNKSEKLLSEYRSLSTLIQSEIKEVHQIYYYGSDEIDVKIKLLDDKLEQAQDIDKSIRLVKEILYFKKELVILYYNDFRQDIRYIVNTYSQRKEYHKLLNPETVNELLLRLDSYLDKDFVREYYNDSNYIKVNQANKYLKTIIREDYKYPVIIRNLILNKDLGRLRIEIGSRNYELTNTSLNIEDKTDYADSEQTSEGKYLYDFKNEELLFSYGPGDEIIIRLYKSRTPVITISSSERGRFPLSYSLPDEKGNHFLIFKKHKINFLWNNEKYELLIYFDDSQLPDYPALFIDIFKEL